jgi:hypothetical protein
VAVTRTTLVDELADTSRALAARGLTIVEGDTRKAREDVNRAAGEAGASLTYRAKGTIAAARVHVFFPGAIGDPMFETSPDGFAWTAVAAVRHDASEGAGDYGYYKTLRYDVPAGRGMSFVRVTLTAPTEIGRVEIEADPLGARK